MAETGDCKADVPGERVKTLQDGQKEGEMKLCSTIDTEEPYNKLFEMEPEEKQTNVDTEGKASERKIGLLEELANMEGRSPCSDGADVSVNSESPGLSKVNSSSEPLEEQQKESSSSYWRKRRRHNRHKGGRHRIRKSWKPYCKLSHEERQKLDDKQTKRATKKRSEQFANGLPMAPYNTTQFLMADHDQPSPQAQPIGHEHHSSMESPDHSPTWDGSSDSLSPDDMTEKMVQEFQEDYQNYHAERLQDLSKEELVKEFIELEAKNEELEGKLDQSIRAKLKEHLDDVDLNGDPATLKSKFMEIVQRMSEENAKLARENQFLKVAAGKLQV